MPISPDPPVSPPPPPPPPPQAPLLPQTPLPGSPQTPCCGPHKSAIQKNWHRLRVDLLFIN